MDLRVELRCPRYQTHSNRECIKAPDTEKKNKKNQMSQVLMGREIRKEFYLLHGWLHTAEGARTTRLSPSFSTTWHTQRNSCFAISLCGCALSRYSSGRERWGSTSTWHTGGFATPSMSTHWKDSSVHVSPQKNCKHETYR